MVKVLSFWTFGTLLLLALATLAWLPYIVVAQCHAPEPVPSQVAGRDVLITNLPDMVEGETYRRPCYEVVPGYDNYIEVFCLGGTMSVRTGRCIPAGCPPGQRRPVRLSSANRSRLVTSTRYLRHREEEFVPCAPLVPGYSGHVRLTCQFGVLEAEASGCRPAFRGASTVWRVVNADRVPTSFRVFELEFYTDANCESGRLSGEPVSSSEELAGDFAKEHAFDRKVETAWGARCPRGCDPNTAWIGLLLTQPSERVRCVRLLQSKVSCCRSDRVRLDVWDGSGWQAMHQWETPKAWSVIATRSLELQVPRSCDQGKPEDVFGVVHDCDGPPVVGRQEGDVCYAKCDTGYYGGDSPFECRADGTFVGSPPTCYEIKSTSQAAFLGGILFFAWCCAYQYHFWCMYRKVRMKPNFVDVPDLMKGRWLEQDGIDIWEKMMDVRKKDADSFPALEDDEASSTGSPKDDKKKAARKSSHKAGGSQEKRKGSEAQDSRKSTSRKSEKKKETGSAGKDDEQYKKYKGKIETYDNMVENEMAEGSMRRKRRRETIVHGLCSICENPEICWTTLFCPICRIADTWHTLGTPKFMTYWRVVLLYYLCPFCWPCLNYYGRFRIRHTFKIPLEPHRDCLIHCCCCCLCAPCAICQEARLADAPGSLHYHRRKLLVYRNPMETAPQQEDMA